VILHVAVLGHPVLRARAEPVPKKQIARAEFQRFLDDLVESMLFHDGVGLAAPQVFVPQRVVAVWIPADMDEGGGLEPSVFVNPVLEPLGEELHESWEGCLSLPDLRGLVPRHTRLRLRALDRQGQPIDRELTGFPARVLQHEVDHLDGVVFPDRMTDLHSLAFGSAMEKAAAQATPPEDVQDDPDGEDADGGPGQAG